MRYDDFQRFVTDPAGHPAVVVPVAPRGSGDGRVLLLAAQPGSTDAERLLHSTPTAPEPTFIELADAAAGQAGSPAVLAEDDPLAQQAFARQG